jgi:hypothetical protein
VVVYRLTADKAFCPNDPFFADGIFFGFSAGFFAVVAAVAAADAATVPEEDDALVAVLESVGGGDDGPSGDKAPSLSVSNNASLCIAPLPAY